MFKYCVISGPYPPAFRLNTDRYGVSLRIQSKCGRIRTRKNFVFGHFPRSDFLKKFILEYFICMHWEQSNKSKLSHGVECPIANILRVFQILQFFKIFLPAITTWNVSKYGNTEFFLVGIFLCWDLMQKNTDQKNIHIRTLFTQWKVEKQVKHLSILHEANVW